MSRELICAWLKIPADPWPPDPFILLGLPPGEVDRAVIEQRVHERMECVRRYQLAHPEVVTDVMNRLAQAFNQLCQNKVEAPPPLELPAPSVLPPPEPMATYQPIEPADNPPPILPAETDPIYENARSKAARRGLATKRSLYQRISTTRRLIRAWAQAGQYLGDVRQQLRNRDEALDLARQLTIIRQQLQTFPTLVGQAGQPGYYVIALARQPRIVQTFQGLADSERERLARDWEGGLSFLAAHRLFLRQEIESLRHKSPLGRLVRAVRAVLLDYPVIWLFWLGLLALNIAHPPLRADWAAQLLIIFAALLMLLVYQAYRGWTQRQSLHRRRRA